jgi:hypothetical protein
VGRVRANKVKAFLACRFLSFIALVDKVVRYDGREQKNSHKPRVMKPLLFRKGWILFEGQPAFKAS